MLPISVRKLPTAFVVELERPRKQVRSTVGLRGSSEMLRPAPHCVLSLKPIPVTSSAVVAYAHSPGSESALALTVQFPKDQRKGPLSSLPSLPIASCSLKYKEDLELERVAGLWIGLADALRDDRQMIVSCCMQQAVWRHTDLSPCSWIARHPR